MGATMPAIFLGHGNPLNALGQNRYSQAWNRIGRDLPRPDAILAISAHWYIPTCAVTAMAQPRTIHDFRGFPPELYQVSYPAPGSLVLAQRVQQLLAPQPVARDEHWGLDHGAWSVLMHLFPEADIPVVQLSINRTCPPAFHFELGQRLAPLREEGVLILGSGNIVHNLRAMIWDEAPVPSYDWAERFDKRLRDLLLSHDPSPLIAYDALGEDAALAVPTPEHYLPLLYVLGTRCAGEAADFPLEGIEGGSISMRAVRFG